MLMTKAELLEHEVYLSDYLQTSSTSFPGETEALPGIKCILYLRPTEENVQAVCVEVSGKPRYSEYYICTTLSKIIINRNEILFFACILALYYRLVVVFGRPGFGKVG